MKGKSKKGKGKIGKTSKKKAETVETIETDTKKKKRQRNKTSETSAKTSPTKVPVSRKRRIASGSSQPVPEKKRKQRQPAQTSQPDDAPKKKPSRKAPPKQAAPPNLEQPIAQAKAKAKAKAKARAASKAKANMEAKLTQSPLRKDSIVKTLMDYAVQFPEELDENPEGLKKAIKATWVPLKLTKLMPYWTRDQCGVKLWDENKGEYKDIHTFSFTSSMAPRRYKLAVAVKSAELAVSFLHVQNRNHQIRTIICLMAIIIITTIMGTNS